MTEKKRKNIIYAIFVIALIWGILNNPFARKKPQWADNSSAEETIQPLVSAGLATPDIKLNLSDQWGSDPFAQKSTNENSIIREAYNFKLTAISESGGEFWALINGRIMAAGESIEGWTVARITRDEAVLQKNGKTMSLKIKGA